MSLVTTWLACCVVGVNAVGVVIGIVIGVDVLGNTTGEIKHHQYHPRERKKRNHHLCRQHSASCNFGAQTGWKSLAQDMAHQKIQGFHGVCPRDRV